MNIYTEKVIKEIIRKMDCKKEKFLGVKLPASLYEPPVFTYLVNTKNLEFEEMINELQNSGLIITANRVINGDDDHIKLSIDCTKYFFEKEDKDAHFEDTISPDYKKRFTNYDEDHNLHERNDECMCKCNQPKSTKPAKPNTLEDDIIKISTDDLIMEILRDVQYQRINCIDPIKELSYDNTFKGKKYDYNKIYTDLSKFAYSINISINDSDALAQTTKISFKYMSK